MSKSTASVNVIKNATASIKSVRPEPKAKKTAAAQATAKVLTPEHEVTADEVTDESAFASFRDMFDGLGFKIPSGRRMAVSVVTQFLVLGTGIYSGFQLGALLAFGAAVMTGSAFLSFLGWFVVVALSVYTSLIAAARIGKYIALGEIDDDMKRARSWVSGKWNSVKERFSGNEEPSHV